MKPYILDKKLPKTVLVLTNRSDLQSDFIGEYKPSSLLRSFCKYIAANVVCFPAIQKYVEKETHQIIDENRPEVIKLILEIKPDIIVLLGKTAGLSLFVEFSPTKDFGKTEQTDILGHKCLLVKGFSPDYVLKSNKDSDLKNFFVIADIVNNRLCSIDNFFTYINCEDSYQFLKLLSIACDSGLVALDYETPSLDDLSIVCVGIAFKDGDKIKSFSYRLPTNFYSLFKRFIVSCDTIVTHNAKFEHKVNLSNFKTTRFLEDTMLMLHIIDETIPVNLQVLSQYCGLNIEWKKDFWSDGSWEKDPELLQYNATDAAVTLYAYNFLLQKLNEERKLYCAYKLFAAYSRSVAEMELNGLYLHHDKELLEKFKTAIDYIESTLGFNVRSRLALEKFILNDLEEDVPVTEKGNPSFTTKFLLNHENKQIQLIGQARQLHAYIQFIQQYLERRDGKGLVHTNYLQTGTRTGRLASQNPNLQNVPKNLVRRFFTSRFNDGVLIEVDYNQLEPRILATLSKDENLLKLFSENKDLHSYVASQVFHKDYETFMKEVEAGNEEYKKMRFIGKQMNLGIMYGLTPEGLAERTDISVYDAELIIKRYYETFKKVKEFQKRCKDSVKKNGYVEDLFGRRRRFVQFNHKTIRQAINFPVTSTGNHCCQLAATYFVLHNTNDKILLCANVHDALLFDLPEKEIDNALDLINKSMDFPNKFLLCKLTWEVKVGKTWFDMEKLHE